MVKQRRIWIGMAGIALLAAISGAVWHFTGGGEGGAGQGVARRKAPRFELTDPAGRKHSLEELRGNWVVLHFWAAWCPPCLAEIPNWLSLARKMGAKPEGQKLRFVAVSTDPRWEDALKVLPVADLPERALSLLDPSTKVAEEYGTYQFPESYLLNPDLEIVAKWVGAQEWTSPRMESELTRVVSGQPASGADPAGLKSR